MGTERLPMFKSPTFFEVTSGPPSSLRRSGRGAIVDSLVSMHGVGEAVVCPRAKPVPNRVGAISHCQ